MLAHCRRAIFRAVLLVSALAFIDVPARGDQQRFQIDRVSITLEDATPNAAVYFTAMRLNRALNVWNVEVNVSNKSDQVLAGPLVLLVDGFNGTSGPQQADGTLAGGKAFYDLSAALNNAALAPGQQTGPRTLALGRGEGSPSLVTKVYAGAPPGPGGAGGYPLVGRGGTPFAIGENADFRAGRRHFKRPRQQNLWVDSSGSGRRPNV